MGIYSDIKKLHMDHSKLLFAIFKICDKGLINQQEKVILKKRVIKSDEKLFEVLHRFTQTGENDEEYLENALYNIAIELNKREPIQEEDKASELLSAQITQKSGPGEIIHSHSPYGTELMNKKINRAKKNKEKGILEEEGDNSSPMKRAKGLYPSRANYHNNAVHERELDFEESEDDEDGPSKFIPQSCFGGKSPPIEDASSFMKLRDPKK